LQTGAAGRAVFLLWLAPLCFAGDASEAHYAGAQVCATCHQEIAASQAKTAMAKTWHGAVTASLPLHYEGRVREGADKSLEYAVRRDGDHFVFAAAGPDGSKVTLPVKVIMGGERHGLSFLASIDNLGGLPLERTALIEARYVYNTPHHALAISPGFPTERPQSFETALGRVLSPTFEGKCLTCHGEPGTLGAGKQGGVRCESCHGPGSGHVQAIARGEAATGILNPKKLTAERALAVCAPCHSGFSYRADPLPKEVLVSSQVPALRQSECFIQSGETLTCTGCHDPHRDGVRAEVERASVKVCLGCHASAAKERAAICPIQASEGCTGCHMPRLEEGVFHLTDHWIRVHPEQGVQARHRDESLRSHVTPRRESLRMIVTGDRAAAERAMERLDKGEAFFDVAHDASNDPTAPGGGYMGEMRLSEMDARLRAAAAKLGYGERSGVLDLGNRWMILERMPRDFKLEAGQIFDQAAALKTRGDVKGALKKGEEALRAYPYLLRGLVFMGVTLAESGAVQKGAEILDFAAQQYPEDATARFDLGLALGGAGNSAGQIDAFRRAIALEPDNTAVYESLSAALYTAGDWQAAIDVCRQGLQVDPLAAKLYYNLSLMLKEHGDAQGAERASALAKKIDPAIVPRR
jgi:predicted CXXCH cytochrome family protein